MSGLSERITQLSPKRLALLALELEERLEAAERDRRQPIAIVGVGCRLPGARDVDAYWALLRDGVDAIREVPHDRWNVDTLYDANPDTPGMLSSRWGGFLEDCRHFDPAFFGISPREAVSMDPQQRLLLEVCWEALERGGISPDRLHGSATGVFLGICNSDYAQLLWSRPRARIDAYLASGNAFSILSGRVSYLLGLNGPSLSVDTACSSSLVAVHLACQSLRAGECSAALAGGVNVILSPLPTIALSKGHMLAADGRCKTFDAAADGFVRGEGCGVVVLKRLSDAQANGDRVLAVIRGTAVNQDGRSSGLTAPNGPSQEAVIKAALASGGVEPADVDYVEAHGTGTSLGDPIEVRALGNALGEGRRSDRPLLIGSVKTNIGHLESAAGVAGLIKLVLSLEHGELPRHLHFTEPNPHIAWNELPVKVVSARTPWVAGARPRVAGVSSFGFSGTNAHVIVEEPPASRERVSAGDRPLHVLTLSARTEPALRELASRYGEHLGSTSDALSDACYTAAAGRSHMSHRLAVVAEESTATAAALRQFAAGEQTPVVTRNVVSGDGPEIVFLFTGQGAQYAGMGRQLYETEPVFKEALDRCDALMRDQLPRPLLSVIFGDENGGIHETGFTQPALLAIEYAVAEMWKAWGVEPAAVMGHSVGEVAAACVAGVLSLEDATALITARGRLMQSLPAGGGMAAVFAAEAQVAAAVATYADRLAIAAVNGPDNVVVSGAADAVEAVRGTLDADGVKSQLLTVSHAFHSPLMRPMLDAFRTAVSRVTPMQGQIGLVSNVTGSWLSRDDRLDADYWVRHVMAPVQFAASMATLHDKGYRVFLEVGPHPTLLGMGRRVLTEGDEAVWVPSLRKGREDWRQVLDSVAALYVRGVEFDWEAFDRGRNRARVALPTYPFQRQEYWPEDLRPGDDAPARSEPWRQWLHELTWVVDTDGGASAGLQRPDAVAADVGDHVDRLYAECGAETYNDLYPVLDEACCAYIVSGLTAAGMTFQTGARFTTGSVADAIGVVPAHRRLFARLVEILVEDGYLSARGHEYEVVREPLQRDPHAMMQELLERFPAHRAELSFTARSAPHLADVLRGNADPIQVLFPGGSIDHAEAVYERAPGLRFFNLLASRGIEAALEDRPADRHLRVLEIGAGTGGTTTYVLPALAGRDVEYVFTDVSSLFAARAREKFSAFDFLDYRTLDIESDPLSQGFARGSFDIVLAANVLHATANVSETLRRVRSLIAPGGMLVLLEATHTQRFGDLTVGYTDGWWRFADTDLRPSYALMSPAAWLSVLEEAGFASASAIGAEQARGRAILQNQAIIFAQLPLDVDVSSVVWVVYGQLTGLGPEFLALVRLRGAHGVLVVPGAEYSCSPGEYTVVAEDASHHARLLEDLRRRHPSAAINVVNLWPIDATVDEESGVEAIADSVRQSCASALAMVQACASAGNSPPQVWLVTRGAQPVEPGGPPQALAQGPLWGLGRVLDLEHPELRCTLLDLPGDGASAALVYDSVTRRDTGDRQLALRASSRFVPRMRSSSAATAASVPIQIDESAAYLITGGLAGLGLLTAERLTDRGARTLVLVGRSEPTVEVHAAIAALEQRGVTIRVVRADVAEPAGISRTFEAIRETGRALKGIIHAAGSIDDGVVLHQNWSRFETVMRSKVRGTWLLHQATRQLTLDFFVLFSTGASFLGSLGQSNHAAANIFMDGLAHYRRSLGLPALSINWGAWSGVGAATRGGIVERMGTRGLRPIDPGSGLAVLEHLVGQSLAQAAVLPIDWPEFIRSYTSGRRMPLFDLAAPRAAVRASLEEPGGVPRKAGTVESLRGMSLQRARRKLAESINREACRILALDASETLDPARPLAALGLDSLMAVELRNALAIEFERPLPATLLFNYPTTGELIDFIASEVLVAGTRDVVPADGSLHEPGNGRKEDQGGDNLDALSEEQLAALLAGKLSGA